LRDEHLEEALQDGWCDVEGVWASAGPCDLRGHHGVLCPHVTKGEPTHRHGKCGTDGDRVVSVQMLGVDLRQADGDVGHWDSPEAGRRHIGLQEPFRVDGSEMDGVAEPGRKPLHLQRVVHVVSEADRANGDEVLQGPIHDVRGLRDGSALREDHVVQGTHAVNEEPEGELVLRHDGLLLVGKHHSVAPIRGASLAWRAKLQHSSVTFRLIRHNKIHHIIRRGLDAGTLLAQLPFPVHLRRRNLTIEYLSDAQPVKLWLHFRDA